MVYLERLPIKQAEEPSVGPAEIEIKGDTPVGSLFEDSRKLAEAIVKAKKILNEYLKKEPKLQEVLDTPQSSDKHAEGPSIAEHYKSILVSLELLQNGFMDFDRASRGMDLEGFREQWDGVLEFIRENRELMLVFAITHDLAKPDCLGIYAKGEKGLVEGFPDKKSFHKKNRDASPEDRRKWRKKYLELYSNFAAAHPEIKEDARIQKAFFDEYGITTTYVGHEIVTPENMEIIERVCAENNLGEEDLKLTVFSINQHVSAYLSFEKGPQDYASLIRLAREAGMDERRAMLSIQAGMLIDGIFGVRKWNDAGTGFMIATKAIKDFWQAEKDYPAYAVEQERKAAEQAELLRLRDVAAKAGLRGNDLKDLGINVKVGFQKVVNAIFDAIRTDQALEAASLSELGLSQDSMEKINERVSEARRIYREERRAANPFST